MQILDSSDYGAFSPKWMIVQSARFVPRENLEESFALLVQYIDDVGLNRPVLNAGDFLDAVAQILLTGTYLPTAFPKDPEPEEAPAPDVLPPITETDIANWVQDLSEWPEAEEPEDRNV